MRLKNKDKIEVFFTLEQKGKIRAYATRAGISMAEVIKRAVEAWLR